MSNFSFFFCCIFLVSYGTVSLPTILQLKQKIEEAQIPSDIPYDLPFSWEKKAGTYPSDIKMNFFGEFWETQLRHGFNVFDDNVFVTIWVFEMLLDTQLMGLDSFSIDADKAMKALQMITTNGRDQNYPVGTPVYYFWEQIQKNGTWIAWPTNLKNLVADEASFTKYLQDFLLSIGLSWVWNEIQPEVQQIAAMANAFKIPPDLDDSSCNLAVGALLFAQKANTCPGCWNYWQQNNGQIGNLAKLAVQYAYRPFSNDTNVNVIDPRSFFFLRDYLYQVQASGNTDQFALPTTWLMDLALNRKLFPKQIAMPFNLNNVDLSVNGNFLYGFVKLFSSGAVNASVDWWTLDFQNLLLQSAKLSQWAIQSNRITQRPDLGMLYYPPIQDVYFFLARSLFELSSTQTNLPPTLRIYATPQILSSVIQEGSYQYWQDFLGLADTFFGSPDPHPDDRLFTTSMALQALIDTWTVASPSCPRSYVPNTPAAVKSAIDQGSSFLNHYILKSDFRFFSGSVKSYEQMEFAFPANFRQFLNGTNLPPNPPDSVITDHLIWGVSGVIDKKTYDQMLQQTIFGMPVPVNFTSFNNDAFPFWTSDVLTEAFCMNLLAKVYLLNQGCLAQ